MDESNTWLVRWVKDTKEIKIIVTDYRTKKQHTKTFSLEELALINTSRFGISDEAIDVLARKVIEEAKNEK